MRLDRHPYASFLHRVAKPARYTGGEYNAVVKDPTSVKVRMALAFPDLYDVGMSHLGTKILYSLLNRHPDIAAERVFCPWPDMEEELRARDLPLVTLETASPLADFDGVGFSLQYELTFTNLLTMLDLSGIPLRWTQRDGRYPLVIAGGPVASQPEPMAPFVDAFLIGDAEEKLPILLLEIAKMKAAGANRRRMLERLAELGGVYCPALYETAVDERTGFVVVGKPIAPEAPQRVERQVVENLDRYPFPDDSPVAAAEAIFDRMAIEIARGCTEGCRFCQAGMIYRPVRERDPVGIVETIQSAVKQGGYDEVGLTTLSTADYSCISPLIRDVMDKLRTETVSLSVASLRAYGLDEDLLDEIRSVRATSLTFAPEAGTQRLRDVINKNISEEDLERTAHRVFRRGWRRLKLYFMIGLPTETDEDVAGIMATGRRMRGIGAEYHPSGSVGVTVSVSSHVPKPHTPFQWCAMDGADEIERKQETLRRLARKHRLEFRRHDSRASFLECILGRGDRRMADVIEEAWRDGARFDSWDDQLRWDAWTEAIDRHPEIPFDLFLGTLPVDGRLPWDHLDMKIRPEFLATEYRRAMQGKLSPPCGKPAGTHTHPTNLADHEADQRLLVCYHCGLECDLTRMREKRGEFLARMEALHPPRVDADRRPLPPVRLRPQENGAKPHEFHQGRRLRYRVLFAKRGAVALTGHLDLVRALPRVLRRAGLVPYYSEGFHPKPVMEFPPPLPLGVESAGEVVELALAREVSPAEMLSRLRAVSPEGLDFRAVTRVSSGTKKFSRLLAGAEYLVRVESDRVAACGLSEEDLRRAPERFLSRGEVPWKVTRKRRVKTVDIRPGVDALRWACADELPRGFAVARPGARHLFVRTRFAAEAHVRPEEAAAAALGGGLSFEPPEILRLRLLGYDQGTWTPLLEPDPDLLRTLAES